MATQTIQNVQQTEITKGPTNSSVIKRKFSNGTAFIVLLVLAILWMIPAAWVVDTSFKPEGETTALPLSWLASTFTGDAYIKVLQAGDLPRWYFNSIFTSVIISTASV